MVRRLDHVAIAVPDLDLAIRRFTEDLGLVLSGTEEVESAQTATAFLPIEGTRIELVHPLRGGGPIAKFLETRRGGLHHLCFESDDLDADVSRLRAKGYVFLTEAPYAGAHGSRVIFLHPRGFDGVLIELSQPAEHA